MHSVRAEQSFEKHIPLISEIMGEPGMILHLAGSSGMIHNFGKRTTRYVDRFFISGVLNELVMVRSRTDSWI